MVVRAARFTFTLVDVKDAFAGPLVDRNDVALSIRQRIDADALAILPIARRREQRELAIGARRIRVRQPLVDSCDLVGVIHVSELVVDRDRLDLAGTAERAEAAYERSLYTAGPIVVETVLPQIVLTRSGLRRDDRENRAVLRTPVQADAHRRALLARSIDENRHRAGRDVADTAAVRCDCVDPQPSAQTLGQHGDVGGRRIELEAVLDVHVVRPIESLRELA